MKTARNASACVVKQPIMVATTSTEHSYWLALAFLFFVYATQAIAFEWKPGLTHYTATQVRNARLNGIVYVPVYIVYIYIYTVYR